MEEDKPTWRHLFPDVPPVPRGKAAAWRGGAGPQGPFHQCVLRSPLRWLPAGHRRVAAVLPAQKVSVKVVDPRGPCRARPGGRLCVLWGRVVVTPRLVSAGSSHLLVSPLGSPVVLESVTHTGPQEPWLTALPLPSRAAWGPLSQGTAPRDTTTLRSTPPGTEMAEGSLW